MTPRRGEAITIRQPRVRVNLEVKYVSRSIVVKLLFYKFFRSHHRVNIWPMLSERGGERDKTCVAGILYDHISIGYPRRTKASTQTYFFGDELGRSHIFLLRIRAVVARYLSYIICQKGFAILKTNITLRYSTADKQNDN